MNWPKRWPAWVILELSARADLEPLLNVAVVRRCMRTEADTAGQDLDSVPRTANSSILRSFRGLQKSLVTYAFTVMLRGPVFFACLVHPHRFHAWLRGASSRQFWTNPRLKTRLL